MKTRCTTCNRNWIISALKHKTDDDYVCPICKSNKKAHRSKKKSVSPSQGYYTTSFILEQGRIECDRI